MTASSAPQARSTRSLGRLRWRVVDIVVASIVGVAVGLVFFAWNLTYNPIGSALGALLPGVQGSVHGVWLIGGVLTALIVRKPGAAIYGEMVAATVSALFGNQWGPLTLLSGLVQGLGAEIVFAILLYKAWGIVAAMLAGAGAGVGMVILDLTLWYAGAGALFATVYAISGIASGAIIAGLLSWLAMRALARTGALDRFAAGRERGSDDDLDDVPAEPASDGEPAATR
ncbi:ECF transporter S component [Microcella sp.]|uniref:ECF transporter S component n=1 Tax=Microcella sp. TaxID=1913979 RepID=UPI003918F2F0